MNVCACRHVAERDAERGERARAREGERERGREREGERDRESTNLRTREQETEGERQKMEQTHTREHHWEGTQVGGKEGNTPQTQSVHTWSMSRTSARVP